ncbi:glycosyltransferase family 2 protein [Neobacillus sp. D3-1R]|uniref:glycosyltransferase family 2 protein n=1 Tax=Neobacillus sp. D3-1R TaxID=3445778 RepID=UPI003FA0FF29
MSSLTIFTPTYNRADKLHVLYESLKSQTNKDFIWLVVDDGSTDYTTELFNKWQNENKIKIRYEYQKNQGKHVAHNYGVSLTKSELFLCVDSDDYLIKEAVETIINLWGNRIHKADSLCGIVTPRVENNKVGELPNIPISTLGNLYKKYGFKGETCLVYKTNIIKKFPFPVFEGEKFLSEVAAYDLIDIEYKYLLYSKPLAYGEYLNDGYTKNVEFLKYKNPKGYAYIHKNKSKLVINFRLRIYHLIRYGVFSRLSNNNRYIKQSPYPLLTVLLIPVIFLRTKNFSKKCKQAN